jgi:hypothetical protein
LIGEEGDCKMLLCLSADVLFIITFLAYHPLLLGLLILCSTFSPYKCSCLWSPLLPPSVPIEDDLDNNEKTSRKQGASISAAGGSRQNHKGFGRKHFYSLFDFLNNVLLVGNLPLITKER